MDCMKISNGDLELNAGGDVALVSGKERIRQDLACWLLEPLGTDSAYPKFGSDIHDYIGEPNWVETRSLVQSEVSRIVSNYMAYQEGEYQRQTTGSSLSYDVLSAWGPDDLMTGEYSMQVSSRDDTIKLDVTVFTQGGAAVDIGEVL